MHQKHCSPRIAVANCEQCLSYIVCFFFKKANNEASKLKLVKADPLYKGISSERSCQWSEPLSLLESSEMPYPKIDFFVC